MVGHSAFSRMDSTQRSMQALEIGLELFRGSNYLEHGLTRRETLFPQAL
jgi:hypothetical protein